MKPLTRREFILLGHLLTTLKCCVVGGFVGLTLAHYSPWVAWPVSVAAILVVQLREEWVRQAVEWLR